ncbi:hypothetical protein [Deinococcus peraridilitoris]|uniref:Uncharacterized protein n=1 Tax=Deinococcus peraridilitoris (strain DSM 19664 / LMG 22246 / CIP 109416 / KR-200) TaxID=937777 RepID=L0A2B4_DEIPD|nr:hypothetical protein [Deinococcus peraridilitoris]AFZ67125.1 hypothetical protein Deipe_1584 [Deinococcus peraridilitoris DSM 19664]
MPKKAKDKIPRTELERIRLALGDDFTQQRIAERISEIIGEEITQPVVSAWERMTVKDWRKVDRDRLRVYAQVLGITTRRFEELIGFKPGELFIDNLVAPEYIEEQLRRVHEHRRVQHIELDRPVYGEFPIREYPAPYKVTLTVDLTHDKHVRSDPSWILMEHGGMLYIFTSTHIPREALRDFRYVGVVVRVDFSVGPAAPAEPRTREGHEQ